VCGTSEVTTRLDAADVALVVTRTEIGDVSVVPVVPVDLSPVRVGDPLTIAGFGCEQGAEVPDDRSAWRLTAQPTVAIDAEHAVHDGSSVGEDDVARVAASYVLTPGPAGGGAALCPGDSGGPLWRRGGALAVAGVNANFTFAPPSEEPKGIAVTNWHTRLDDGSRFGVGSWLASLGVTTTHTN
jgi:hypothetical protein